MKSSVDDFDNRNRDEASISPARPLLDSILPFLWGASNSKIEALPRIADLDDEELQDWGERMHLQFMASPLPTATTVQTSPSDSALVLANNIENQTNMMEKILDRKDKEKEEKKSKVENLPEATQNLISNASSPDGEFVPESPTETCVEFFKKKDGARARDFLEETLELKFGCVVSVDRGASLAIYAGAFVRDLDDLPSNFSFLLVPKKKPSASGQRNKSMMLQLKVLNGQGWSEKDFKDAAKQGIEAPSSIEELRFQLENLAGLAAFFFGEKSLLTRRLIEFTTKIKTRVVAFDAQQESDFEFASKIGYAVDTRTFRWLQQCRDASDREGVDDLLVNFTPILNDVLLDRFVQPLPESISCFSKKKRKSDADEGRQGPKKPKGNEDETKKVFNEDMEADWALREGEDYSLFAGKNQELKPKTRGRYTCSRWFIKGFCFESCKNKITHLTPDELPHDTKTQMTTWVRACRGE